MDAEITINKTALLRRVQPNFEAVAAGMHVEISAENWLRPQPPFHNIDFAKINAEALVRGAREAEERKKRSAHWKTLKISERPNA